MAATTTSTMDDVVAAAAILESRIIDYARANAIIKQLVTKESAVGRGSKVIQFPKWGALAAAGLTEGTDMTSTAISSSNAQVTVGEVGVQIALTDLLAKTSNVNFESYARQCGLAIADKEDSDLATLFASFATTVGTTGNELTLDLILTAIYHLKTANAPGQYACVLHPRQVLDLRTLIAGASGSTATIYAGRLGPDLAVKDGAFVTSFMGVNFYEDTNVAKINANADYCGAMFSELALGHGGLWDVNVEAQRDASLRAVEINATACYGVAELVDLYGVGIVSKVAL